MSVATTLARGWADQDRGHRAASGAQVHGDPGPRQQRDGSSCHRLRVRPGHEHTVSDVHADAAEVHRPGDPGQRLPAQPASQELLDRSDALARCREERVGFGIGSDEACLRQRVREAGDLPCLCSAISCASPPMWRFPAQAQSLSPLSMRPFGPDRMPDSRPGERRSNSPEPWSGSASKD